MDEVIAGDLKEEIDYDSPWVKRLGWV
ncbi:uncharacterized protein FTOL_12718 [Fusarium torulosum]|uniref:Uncharacterized protein n=1 Tax=Fusarium torulosum TaxID=33205 RepID=A0AAE8MML1_9HYPO|nr:uncharacterized protein FTOL_12718 [Fusarium torulosum]